MSEKKLDKILKELEEIRTLIEEVKREQHFRFKEIIRDTVQLLMR